MNGPFFSFERYEEDGNRPISFPACQVVEIEAAGCGAPCSSIVTRFGGMVHRYCSTEQVDVLTKRLNLLKLDHSETHP